MTVGAEGQRLSYSSIRQISKTQKPKDRKMVPSLLNITIEQVAQGLDDGAFTVIDLVRGYIRRIEEVNHLLNAVIQVNPAAESVAVSLDEELKRYGRRGEVTERH